MAAGAAYPVTIDPRLEGGVIYVGYLSFDEDNPAVAYSTSSGQYLVVFESDTGNGDIVGRFVNAATGVALGNYFYVANSSYSEKNPDVPTTPTRTGSWSSTRLETWESQRPGRLVLGYYVSSGSQLAAVDSTMIAGETADAYDPTVAYNAHDHQFVVSISTAPTWYTAGWWVPITPGPIHTEVMGSTSLPTVAGLPHTRRGLEQRWRHVPCNMGT